MLENVDWLMQGLKEFTPVVSRKQGCGRFLIFYKLKSPNPEIQPGILNYALRIREKN